MAFRVLFVCLGNICRSPSAENLMNYWIEQKGLTGQIECDSAGTSGYHVGARPDSRRAAAARESPGIELKGRSRQFTIYDFDEFDLILAMDRDNYHNILALDQRQQYRDKVVMMCDFCRHHADTEVPDPYYGGEAGFRKVIDLLMDACEGLVDHIQVSQPLVP
ncbi:MAG: low molecular weight protein-tyrosine-phosphatase [Cyanobacteria bacterium P01_H01_bin.130]